MNTLTNTRPERKFSALRNMRSGQPFVCEGELMMKTNQDDTSSVRLRDGYPNAVKNPDQSHELVEIEIIIK